MRQLARHDAGVHRRKTAAGHIAAKAAHHILHAAFFAQFFHHLLHPAELFQQAVDILYLRALKPEAMRFFLEPLTTAGKRPFSGPSWS